MTEEHGMHVGDSAQRSIGFRKTSLEKEQKFHAVAVAAGGILWELAYP